MQRLQTTSSEMGLQIVFPNPTPTLLASTSHVGALASYAYARLKVRMKIRNKPGVRLHAASHRNSRAHLQHAER